MELMAKDVKGKFHIAKELVYISPCTDKFFLKKSLHKILYNIW